MSWRVRALVGDKKRTCKVAHSTSVREPDCFELFIDVDKTPAQPVSGKQHLRFLHGIARASGCCCTYNISCLGITKFVWARQNTNQTLSRKSSHKSLIVERLQLTAIFRVEVVHFLASTLRLICHAYRVFVEYGRRKARYIKPTATL
ncbi:unnamed protein product [Ascophyllum nodosum]